MDDQVTLGLAVWTGLLCLLGLAWAVYPQCPTPTDKSQPTCITDPKAARELLLSENVTANFVPSLHAHVRSSRPWSWLVKGPPRSAARTLDFLSKQVLSLEGNSHKRVRSYLDPFLHVSKDVEALVHSTCNDVLDRLIDRILESTQATSDRDKEGTRSKKYISFDLVSEYSSLVPKLVMCRLLGLDPGLAPKLKEWVDAVEVCFGESHIPLTERLSAADAGIHEFCGQVDHEVLAELGDHQLPNLQFLLIAGIETTAHLVSAGVYRLLTRHQESGCGGGDNSFPVLTNADVLAMAAVVSPVKKLFRQANKAFCGKELGAVTKGQWMEVDVEACNQSLPDGPRSHIAFGYGRHSCPGRALGVVETRVILNTLFHRFPVLSFAQSNPIEVSTIGSVGSIETLWVRARVGG